RQWPQIRQPFQALPPQRGKLPGLALAGEGFAEVRVPPGHVMADEAGAAAHWTGWRSLLGWLVILHLDHTHRPQAAEHIAKMLHHRCSTPYPARGRRSGYSGR